MFTKLDSEVVKLLCCALCKGQLEQEADALVCSSCATRFGKKAFSVGDHNETIYDFRLHYPSYCIPPIMRKWRELQDVNEDTTGRRAHRDPLEKYLGEIDSVKEIFRDEFRVKGRVLDVGGHLGKFRHFLGEDAVLYVSVDPYWDAFRDIQHRPNLLKAYPCMNHPCNFLAANAEQLPFTQNSFDWVEMISVVDHLADPFLAFKEAFRVLRPGGCLMIGLAIVEKITMRHSKKHRNVLSRCVRKLKKGRRYSFWTNTKVYGGPDDDHMYRFRHKELLELLVTTGFEIEKEHWQKKPMDFCLYVTGRKKQ